MSYALLRIDSMSQSLIFSSRLTVYQSTTQGSPPCRRDGRRHGARSQAGLEGIVVAATRLSEVDGERGRLIIGGFPVEELAPHASFEEVLFLLWHGRLPSPASAARWRRRWREQRGAAGGDRWRCCAPRRRAARAGDGCAAHGRRQSDVAGAERRPRRAGGRRGRAGGGVADRHRRLLAARCGARRCRRCGAISATLRTPVAAERARAGRRRWCGRWRPTAIPSSTTA